MPIEITQKSTQNRQTVVDLKRDRDIGRKAVLNDVKTAFTCTPACLKARLLKTVTFSVRYKGVTNYEVHFFGVSHFLSELNDGFAKWHVYYI